MRKLPLLLFALLFAAGPAVYSQTYTLLYSFGSKNGDANYPASPGMLAQSRGGRLFSTAGDGNSGNTGKVISLTTSGVEQILRNFPAAKEVTSGLTLATDGQFYGATTDGGDYGFGSIFKITQDGVFTRLYSFHGGADGSHPVGPPIESLAGQFYGSANGGGSAGMGTIYKITKYGEFTLLHTFTGADGSGPTGPLTQGTDYFFYGTATGGGVNGDGTIFRVDRDGVFNLLHSFDGTHGQLPTVGLIQANDGDFYGVTPFGGTNSLGVVFKMDSGYSVTVLHNFDGTTDGYGPWAPLLQATDGNLYGTANGGGPFNDGGVLFRISTAGGFSVLHNFTGGSSGTGWRPLSALMQHTNGLLYGMTKAGGERNQGAFYSLNVGLKPFVSYLPTYGRAGAPVQILGQGFTADSTVSFNGVPANFTVVSSTYIRAFVPGGATTGPITVTTAFGTLTSNKVFIVHSS